MSDSMQYKGYEGSVEYSAEDKMLHGRILGIRDMVSYGGTGVDDLETNFKGAVDQYLEFCRVEGQTPNKPFKGSFNVRIGPTLHQRAARFAEEHDRKLNAVIVDALQEYLAKSA